MRVGNKSAVLSGVRRTVPLFAAAIALLTISACGGAPALRLSPGVYEGPNELDFAVTAPVRRQMPPERHRGRAEVVRREAETLTLRLQMFEGGDTCELELRQTSASGEVPETFVPVDGQQCGSRFSYDGTPVAAVVSIDEGGARYDETGLHVRLSGRFLATTSSGSVPIQVEGIAAWEFDGAD